MMPLRIMGRPFTGESMNVAEPTSRPIVVGCPHCRQALRVAGEMQGRTITCPKCRGALVVPPSVSGDSSATSDLASKWALRAAIGAVHLFIALMIWVAEGGFGVWFVFCVIATIELAVWQRKWLGQAISNTMREVALRQRERQKVAEAAKQRQGIDEAYQIAQSQARTKAPPVLHAASGPSSLPQPLTSAPSPQPHAPTLPPTHRSEPIPPRNSALGWFAPRGGIRSLTQAGANLPPHSVMFYGSGTVLQLDRVHIHSPLVYATAVAHHGSFDASLIDGSLPIAGPNPGPTERLPYWPTYQDASPQQRSKYLDWLAAGRSDPTIELGYVFIYFYGLERRVLLDDADHQVIAEEVLRLRTIYTSSRSFQRYTASLLWMIVALGAKRRLLSADLVERIFATAERWDAESLGRCLAYYVDSGTPLDASRALLVAQQDHRVPKSIIVRRHDQLFRELFAKKFAEQFPRGLELKASKKDRPLGYHPASSTLLQNLGSASERFSSLPNVLAIESQFKPLIGIWNECIEDLKAYDKAHRSTGELSIEAYEALPTELRTGDHPDFDRWFQIWQECANADAAPIVPVPRLAALKNIAERRTLLKPQCTALVNTATCLGMGIEPDFRMLGRNYRWDDTVTLFLLDGEETADAAAYQAASGLLQLGLFVAAADGKVDPDEIARITEHIEDQFELSPNQSRRLEALRFMLLHTKPDPAKVFTALKKRLTPAQRLVIGEYLLGIAAADQVVTPEESACLRRVFTALDLPQSTLAQLLQPIVGGTVVDATATGGAVNKTTAASATTGFYLDPHAISRIMHDTEAVATILRNAMVEVEEEDADEAPPAATVRATATATPTPAASPPAPPKRAPQQTGPTAAAAVTFTTDLSPPPRFRAFFEEVVARAEWPEAEAKQLARKHQVMLSGAIEALNEWSQERWNDWLIEEGDPVRVRQDLLERKAN